MHQFTEFFHELFGATDWPPRWYCGRWTDFHGWLYIYSDVMIWLSYFLIPVILVWFIQKQKSLPFSPIFWLFSAFIILCGATHLIDAIIFWIPLYRLSALLRFFTAVISLATVFVLIKMIPQVINYLDEGSKIKGEQALKAHYEELLIEKENTITSLRNRLEQNN